MALEEKGPAEGPSEEHHIAQAMAPSSEHAAISSHLKCRRYRSGAVGPSSKCVCLYRLDVRQIQPLFVSQRKLTSTAK
jgi:hypothetical protein